MNMLTSAQRNYMIKPQSDTRTNMKRTPSRCRQADKLLTTVNHAVLPKLRRPECTAIAIGDIVWIIYKKFE